MRILMVCLGNICRSPIAEGVLRARAAAHGLDWTVESAGTESYHIGQPPHRYSQNICRLNGIDISSQRARRFTPADFSRYDRIYAMADDVLAEIRRMAGRQTDEGKLMLFLEELYPGTHASVPDPWYGEEEGYAQVYDLISRTCDAIIRKYAGIQAAKP